MKQVARLPASFEEAAALEFVRQEMDYWRRHKLPLPFWDDAVDVFDQADARRLARERFKDAARSDACNMMVVVEWARAGWDIAQDVLRDLILEYENTGRPKPTYLAAYNMEIVAGWQPPRISGPKRGDQIFRDILIVSLVGRVHEIFRLPLTASSRRRRSCCAVVGEGFSLGEETVRGIWKQIGRPNF
jgi:hypothetical protein